MSRRRIQLTILSVALATALAAGPAHATVRDYDPDNPEWNGLSDLSAIAQAQGLTLQATDHIDWSQLDPDKDVLVIMYPNDAVDAGQITAWLRAGGRALLADDFGSLDPVFSELGLARKPAAGVHPVRWYQDNPSLPVATAWDDDHPLAEGAGELVTNHPAILRVDRGAPDLVYGFGKGEAVVLAGKLGPGIFVALSDPSVLINGMLAFDGNLAFAQNLVRFLAPSGGGGRLVLVSKQVVFTGDPPQRYDGELGLPDANKKAHDVNSWLKDLNDWVGDEQALRAIAVLGAFALVLLGMALLPLARRERLDGSWTKAHGGHDRVDVDQLVARYDDPRWDGSYAFPAALLRENLEEKLGALIGAAEPLKLPVAELIGHVRRAAGERAAQALADVVDRVRSLPTREQAAALFHARVVSRREFERVYDAAHELEKTLAKASAPPA